MSIQLQALSAAYPDQGEPLPALPLGLFHEVQPGAFHTMARLLKVDAGAASLLIEDLLERCLAAAIGQDLDMLPSFNRDRVLTELVRLYGFACSARTMGGSLITINRSPDITPEPDTEDSL